MPNITGYNLGTKLGNALKSGASKVGKFAGKAALGGIPAFAATGNVPIALGTGLLTAATLPSDLGTKMQDTASSGLNAVQQAFGAGPSGGSQDNQELARFSPEIQQLLMQHFQQASAGRGTEGFDPIEDRYRKLFEEQTIPSIAERFTAMGSGNQSSSAFPAALGRAGSDLESQLAALRAQYGQQQEAFDVNKMLGLLPALEKNYLTNRPGFGESLGQSVLRGGVSGLGDLAKMYFANKLMGSQSSIGNSTGNILGGKGL